MFSCFGQVRWRRRGRELEGETWGLNREEEGRMMQGSRIRFFGSRG